MSDPFNNLGSIWYQSEPSDFPIFQTSFWPWTFCCLFLQHNSFNSKYLGILTILGLARDMANNKT